MSLYFIIFKLSFGLNCNFPFKLHWRLVYKLMELGIDAMPDSLSIEDVHNLYEQGTNFLRARVSYIFDSNKRFHLIEWTLATWSNYIGRNKIMKLEREEQEKLTNRA